MYCRKCGYKIATGDVFCRGCGARLCINKEQITKGAENSFKKKLILWICSVVTIIILAVILAVSLGKEDDTSKTEVVKSEAESKQVKAEKDISISQYTVELTIYNAISIVAVGDEEILGQTVDNASLQIRYGAKAYEGAVVYDAELVELGKTSVCLASGIYTVEINAEGYESHYMELVVEENDLEVNAYLLPEIQDERLGIVLVWNSAEVDLDLNLFAQNQSTNGETKRIWGPTYKYEKGSVLIQDNGNVCEVMYIDAREDGNCKLYVNDYLNSINGNCSSDVLATIGCRVYVYNKEGFLMECSCPSEKTGVVWEVLEVIGDELVVRNQVYENIAGETWWMVDKEVAKNDTYAMDAYNRFLNYEKNVLYEGTEFGFGNLVYTVGMEVCSGGLEEYCIEDVKYAFVDCGMDGIHDLLICFGTDKWELSSWYYIISYECESDELRVVDEIKAGAYSTVSCGYSGIVFRENASGGVAPIVEEGKLITNDGEVLLYTKVWQTEKWSVWEMMPNEKSKNLLAQYIGMSNEIDFGFTFCKYTIAGNEYYAIDGIADEIFLGIMDECQIVIYSMDEIYKLVEQQLQDIASEKEIAEAILFCDKEIEWQIH